MATRTQRMKVGAFLIMCASLIFAGVSIIMGYSTESYSTYYVQFEENILGLGVGGMVEYLGVPVGSVEDIHVDQNNQAQVQITVSDDKVTLREGVKAELRIYSLATGTMVVSLEGGDPQAQVLKPGSVIPTRESLLTNITNVVQTALLNISDIAETLEGALEGLEDRKLTTLIENIDGMVSDVRTMVKSTNETVSGLDGELRTAIREYTALAQEARGLSDDVRSVSNNASEFMATAREKLEPLDIEGLQSDLRTTLNNVNGLAENLQGTVKEINTTSESVMYDVDTLQRSLRDTTESLTETMATVDGLAEQIRRDPGSVLRGPSRTGKELP